MALVLNIGWKPNTFYMGAHVTNITAVVGCTTWFIANSARAGGQRRVIALKVVETVLVGLDRSN